MPTANLKFRIQNLKFHQGFTLIELLVVISIIAILLAVATVSFTNAQEKGRDNKRKSDLKAVQQSLELYYNQNGKYPFLGTTAGRLSCTNGSGGIAWGTSFTCTSVSYMNPLPRDPIVGTATDYWYWSNNSTTPANQTYQLYAKIENVKDQDLINTSQATCSNNPGTTWQTNSSYYCVVNP